MEDQLLKYGLAGIFILTLIAGLRILWKENMYIRKEHSLERETWRKTIEQQFHELEKRDDMHVAETEKRDQEHKDLLNDIKRLLQPRNHRQ